MVHHYCTVPPISTIIYHYCTAHLNPQCSTAMAENTVLHGGARVLCTQGVNEVRCTMWKGPCATICVKFLLNEFLLAASATLKRPQHLLWVAPTPPLSDPSTSFEWPQHLLCVTAAPPLSGPSTSFVWPQPFRNLAKHCKALRPTVME